ncbi:MAG: M48 family metallopeptidase [Methylococcales bacterium]
MNRLNRLTELVLIFAVSVMQTACVTNPYTHRSQLIMMSEAQDTQMGLQAFQTELQQASDRISNDPVETAPVMRVAEGVVAAAMRSRYAETAKRFKWQIVVIRDNQVANASCLPGGKIMVYTGIFPFAANEAGLAAILGHEVTHALARHAAERMSQTTLVQVGMATANLAMAANGVNPIAQQQIMQAVGLGTKYGVLLPFSREHESEADYIGLLLAAQAGYDPEEAVRVWQRMEQAGGEQPPEFLSTHPSHGTRIQQLQQWMPEALGYYRAANQVRHKCSGRC